MAVKTVTYYIVRLESPGIMSFLREEGGEGVRSFDTEEEAQRVVDAMPDESKAAVTQTTTISYSTFWRVRR